ncbi:hypothetical protein C1645_813009 [Glomus cerebriforme]|uniref:Uncharacterized protein n=1 Tax=Glomus cerebriforme TaxID=658196 RepID=A0A397TLM8_9GLOM|nr:hypothetical protein C1645_813009 [Glomus cerebriforme]
MTTSRTQKPKANNFVFILEQFLKKHNLSANSTSKQLSKHASKLDVLLPDWIARRYKRKKNLTIKKKAKYCAKNGDIIDIFANHLDLSPKNNDENEIITSCSFQLQFHMKLIEGEADPEIINFYTKDQRLIQESNKIQKKEDLADVIVILSMRLAEAIKTKKLSNPVFTESEICNAWPFNEFLNNTESEDSDFESEQASSPVSELQASPSESFQPKNKDYNPFESQIAKIDSMLASF